MDAIRSPASAYPDLGDMTIEESDPLPPLQSTVAKSRFPPPKRPPPPRSSSAPANMIAGSTPKVPHYGSSSGDAMSLNTGMLPSSSFPNAASSSVATSPSSPSLSGSPRPIQPLKPHEVRWFYEEPGKAWTPFNGHDSLCLEDCYQRWQKTRGSGGECEVSVLGNMYEANLVDKMCKPIYWSDKSWKVLRGTWFEVSGEKWYPLEEQDSVLIEKEHCRMSWRNRASEQQRLKKATATSPDTSKPCEVVMNRLPLEKYEVLWMANDTIFKQKKEITSQLWSMVGERLGKGQAYGAARLQRGYKDAASHEHREPPIGHLVLIVHGIGQNMESSDICRDTNSLRTACAQVAKKQFPEEWSQRRVEFLPCEWRTWLTLDKGVVNTITPQGLKLVRSAINDTVLDVMFYLSPKYGPEIMDGLRFTIHKQYKEFMKRNPNFSGTVSVFAHSLGSVMVYDLLLETCKEKGVEHSDIQPSKTGACEGDTKESIHTKKAVELQNTSEVRYNRSGQSLTSSFQSSHSHQHSPAGEDTVDFRVGGGSGEEGGSNGGVDPQASVRAELEQLKQRVAQLESQLGVKKQRGLNFTIDHFFAVGSPLPLFLVMREHDCLIKKGHRGAASLLPTCICKRVHNLHHPSDPIAYRLEPLVNALYAQVKPVKLDSASSKSSKDMVDLAQGPRQEKEPPPPNKGWFPLFSSSKKTEPPPQTKVPDSVVNDDKLFRGEDRLRERLDFVMRESVTEISYINSIMAHFSYWSSQDCAQYLLLQLYSYKPTDP